MHEGRTAGNILRVDAQRARLGCGMAGWFGDQQEMTVGKQPGCEDSECQAEEVEHTWQVGGEPPELCELGRGKSRASLGIDEQSCHSS